MKIGIIAEDESDVSSLKIIINRLTNKSISTGHFVGKGCGKIKRKCNSWADTLKNKGCNVLIILHDSDTSEEDEINNLKSSLASSLSPCSISKNIIVIPVQELESWFLSDPSGIKIALNLKKMPKINREPERIDSPKEFLGDLILKFSNNEKLYINTKHNDALSKKISLELVKKKCKSFLPFYNFIFGLV